MKANNINNNAELNKAILEVITHQFKKEVKEAHKIVEAAGYEIIKGDHKYLVKNNETGRLVYISNYATWNSKTHRRDYPLVTETNYKQNTYLTDYSKVDYVNLLATPYNMEWHTSKEFTNNNYSESHWKYERLKDAKWDVNYYTERSPKRIQEEMEKLHKQMEALQRELVRVTRREMESKAKLDEVRREIGLIK